MYLNDRLIPNSTTATRRRAQRRLDASRYIHVSQYYILSEVTDPKTKVVTVQMLPAFVDAVSGKAKGRTYRVH